MRPAEELRYLILAIQREGNRLLATDLRPLGVTPSQAEVIRVLADHQPLTLLGLGQLLVCETGGSPSRLVDRLVLAGLIGRETDPADRRQVTLVLTEEGERLAAEIAGVEQRLYQTIDELIEGAPVQETLALLRTFADAFPAGQAVARRATTNRKATP
ncbi:MULTISPECIES: MarR family winged helix-turn-helix transcriptional regulator [Nonomuraea]|jgi:DNA-binding MarR family transcriptional regulator|uniref:MarR family winged helix-turn-helix transcriptional regulator n=1 Tax=Nonomuraea salmonea TaxID=46181 RepID=A0ABV5NNZ6_9ACTN